MPSAQTIHEEWARQMAGDAGVRAMSEEMAGSVEAINEAITEGLGTWDPRVGAGLLRLGEAIEDLEGTAVRSVTTVALVPLGVSLNRQELLAWVPATMGDQLRAEAAGAARQAAVDAARNAVGGITRGLLGGGRNNPPPPPPPAADAPAVTPLLRITINRENLAYRESGDDVLGTLESRIAGYQARTYEDLSRELR